MGCWRFSVQPTTQRPIPASRWCLRVNSVHIESSRHPCVGDSGSKGRGYHRPVTWYKYKPIVFPSVRRSFNSYLTTWLAVMSCQDSTWSQVSIWRQLVLSGVTSMKIDSWSSWDPWFLFEKTYPLVISQFAMENHNVLLTINDFHGDFP